MVATLALRSGKLAAGLMLLLSMGMVLQGWPTWKVSNWKEISDTNRMPELAEFSSKSNALVVLMDTMSSDVFEEVVLANPPLRAAFAGFTLYPDTVGAAPTTYLSMPTIHSGETYQAGSTLTSHYEKAVHDHSVLSKIADLGYKSLLLNPVKVCPKNVVCFESRSAMTDDQSSVQSEGMKMLDAVLFRVAPLALKQRIYNHGEWILQKYTQDKRFIQRSVEGNYLLREMAQAVSPASDTPTLKFIHLMTTHPPYVYNAGCQYARKNLPATRENFSEQVRCSLESFVVLLNALREKNLFDRTAIVLMADHGNYQLASTRTDASKSWATIISSANPTFAIKPLGSKGPFKMGTGEVHIGDFGATLCDLLEVCEADAGTSARNETRGRVRVFNDYRWKHEFWQSETIPGLSTYEVKGPIGKQESWTKLAPVD